MERNYFILFFNILNYKSFDEIFFKIKLLYVFDLKLESYF